MYIDFIRSHELWTVLYTYNSANINRRDFTISVIPSDTISAEITLDVGIIKREFAFQLVENKGSLKAGL